MRWLKKINKGFILTIIVLIVLVIYLVCVEASRNKEKPNIENACKEYITLMNNYAIMPKNCQKVYNIADLSSEEQTKVQNDVNKEIETKMNKLEKELTDKMIDNKMAIDMQKERVEEFVKNQNNIFETVRVKFDKQIKKIKKFVFDEKQVTVTFDSKVDEELRYLNADYKEISSVKDFDTSDETITLQNVDGTWKVVYADLQYYNYSGGSYPIGMTISY